MPSSMASSTDREGQQAAASASRAAMKQARRTDGGGMRPERGGGPQRDDGGGGTVGDYLSRMEELERRYEEDRREKRPSGPRGIDSGPATDPLEGVGSRSRSATVDPRVEDSASRVTGRARVAKALKANPALSGLPVNLVRQ